MIDPLAELGAIWRALVGTGLGLIAGSFLATLTLRWPANRTLAGRSRCDGCGATLRAEELVPVLSFILARGRCGRCGGPIAWQHPLMEMAGAGIGLASMGAHAGWDGAAGAVFGWLLLALGVLDVRHLWLPDRLTLPLLVLGLAAGAAGMPPPLVGRVAGAALGWVALAAVASAYRRLRGRAGLGGGDPKLLAGIGAWLGWQALPLVILLAAGVGLAAVAASAALGRKVSATQQLPFGAMLAVVGWPLWLVSG